MERPRFAAKETADYGSKLPRARVQENANGSAIFNADHFSSMLPSARKIASVQIDAGPKSLGNSVTIISGLPDVAKWRRGESPLNFSRRRDPGYCLIPRLLVIRLRTFSDENFVRGPSSSSPMSPVSPARGYKSGRKKAGRKFRTEAAFAKRGRRGECTRGEGERGNTGGAWNREIRGRSDAN